MKKLITDRVAQEELLRDFSGQDVKAQIWRYEVGLGRMYIRLFRDAEINVWLVALGCVSIRAMFRWQGPSLNVTHVVDHANGTLVHIHDLNSSFELYCSSVTIAMGPPSESDACSYGFLDDTPSDSE